MYTESKSQICADPAHCQSRAILLYDDKLKRNANVIGRDRVT